MKHIYRVGWIEVSVSVNGSDLVTSLFGLFDFILRSTDYNLTCRPFESLN